VDLPHPVLGGVPWIGKYFGIRATAMSGSGTTVKQTTRRMGPSERMNVAVGDWDRSLLNTVTGQSGHFGSSHYRDQWDAWYNGTSFPMQFERVDENNTQTLVPRQAR
jgi:penicillin amidase